MATTEEHHTAPALVPVRTFEGLAAVIGEVYPRWHVWPDGTGWHAMRRGSYRQLGDAGGVHSLHSPDPVLLVLQFDAQDRIPPPDGWDTAGGRAAADPAGDRARARREKNMTRSVREDTATGLMRIRAAHPGWDVARDDARRAWWASLRISPTATHDIYAHSLPVLEGKLNALASARLGSAETAGSRPASARPATSAKALRPR
ncbi:MAG TPA: hypothetical protein VMV07_13280 [Streptosporangiaceae bacterium]|nr:hypothetical protein [Streptosporangiaceae bacterium]